MSTKRRNAVTRSGRRRATRRISSNRVKIENGARDFAVRFERVMKELARS